MHHRTRADSAATCPGALLFPVMPAAAPSVDLPAVRAWARENGLKVGDRGRLPAGLVEQFLQANPKAASSKQRAAAKTTPKAASRPTAPRAKAPAASSRNAPLTPASSRAADAPRKPRPTGPTVRNAAEPPATAGQQQVDVVLLDDEQVELLRDLPAVLKELNTELDAVQQTLKDVQAENRQIKERLDRLETKRGLFNRK